ncbi:Uncharacterized protein TCM_032184 [Theobroma cacao]|uniref:Uncharacterized protein n=1 Tax=Theobroma cacao TaxID=3641 RepID=A0A061F899_THECC|nr:Uncharacterized protein TCM_032184 [Theobroma cacao]
MDGSLTSMIALLSLSRSCTRIDRWRMITPVLGRTRIDRWRRNPLALLTVVFYNGLSMQIFPPVMASVCKIFPTLSDATFSATSKTLGRGSVTAASPPVGNTKLASSLGIRPQNPFPFVSATMRTTTGLSSSQCQSKEGGLHRGQGLLNINPKTVQGVTVSPQQPLRRLGIPKSFFDVLSPLGYIRNNKPLLPKSSKFQVRNFQIHRKASNSRAKSGSKQN